MLLLEDARAFLSFPFFGLGQGEDLVSRTGARRFGVAGAMVLAVAAIAGLATLDARRESAAALRDFAQEQATLAAALGAALRLRASAGAVIADAELARGLHSIERPGALAILVRPPDGAALTATDGRTVSAPRLLEALARGEAVVRLGRDEAPAFGLSRRTALAGLARVDVGGGRTWDVVAVASAERERDREDRARRRLMLSVTAAAGLVVAFGGVVLRMQRKELVLERELALASLREARDERLERASKAAAMGTLAMGVAHEISTPLGVIAARGEQIRQRAAGDPALSGSVSAILSQTDRISQIIRGLLGLARGDAPSSQRLEPPALIENAVALVEHRFAKAGVALEVPAAPPEAAPAVVLGDPRLLEHAIVNLLLNACEACQAGGQVSVSLHCAPGKVEIAVDDSGVGISPADVDRALEPFFTTKAREGGTGLGLAIVHEIVASHRGSLRFGARATGGTRAVISLPAVEGAPDV